MFTLFWLDGTTEVIYGDNISNAFGNAGYGGGVISALDFWKPGNCKDSYTWNQDKRSWFLK